MKNINFDFDTFRHNLLTSNHLKTFCSSYVIEFLILSVFFPKQSSVEFSVVSSAYSIKANLWQAFTMSLMNQLKRSGPIMEPWGTPVKTCFIVDLTSPICTNYLRFFRYLI